MPWSLECEKKVNRQDFVNLYNDNPLFEMEEDLAFMLTMTIILFFYTVLMIVCVACAIKQIPQSMILSFLVPVSAGIAFLCFVCFRKALNYKSALELMEEYLV